MRPHPHAQQHRVGDAWIKCSDMPEDQLRAAVRVAEAAMGKHRASLVERDVAMQIKQHFDKEFGGVWHCVVGRSFGSFVGHASGGFCYFVLDMFAVLLFKA